MYLPLDAAWEDFLAIAKKIKNSNPDFISLDRGRRRHRAAAPRLCEGGARPGAHADRRA